MTRRTLLPLALAAALAACGASPRPASNPSPNRSPPVVETESRIIVVDASGPIPPDLSQMLPMMRRTARIEARPDSVRLAVGGRYDLAQLRIAFLDSAGVEIRDLTPRYTVSGAAARVDREGWLEAVRPGTATLLIRPAARSSAPRPGDPVGRVRIRVVVPADDAAP